MGIVKQALIQAEEEREIEVFLKAMLERDELKGKLAGISKYAIDKGIDNLSTAQRNVIDDFIKNFKKSNVCDLCVNDLVETLMDYVAIYDDDICPSCEIRKEKFLED